MFNTFESLYEVVRDIECEPYRIRLDCILCVRHMSTVGKENSLNNHRGEDHVFFVQAKLWRKDTNTHVENWGQGGKYFISPYSSISEVTRVCLKACLAYSEHEIREAFKYRGKRIYGPHISATGLMEACEDLDVRK